MKLIEEKKFFYFSYNIFEIRFYVYNFSLKYYYLFFLTFFNQLIFFNDFPFIIFKLIIVKFFLYFN